MASMFLPFYCTISIRDLLYSVQLTINKSNHERIQDFWKGGSYILEATYIFFRGMYNSVGIRLADFISFSLNIP